MRSCTRLQTIATTEKRLAEIHSASKLLSVMKWFCFNHSVKFDIMTIERINILQVLDEVTRFQAACRMEKVSAEKM